MRGGVRRRRLERRDQRGLAAALNRDRIDDRHAELALERRAIEVEAARSGEIAHVQCDQHRPAELAQLERESQVRSQVGRVDDADDEVRRGFVGEPAEQQVAGDRLVERASA